MMIMSHYGISAVINVRLYNSQNTLKMGARKKTCPELYITPIHVQWLWAALHVGM